MTQPVTVVGGGLAGAAAACDLARAGRAVTVFERSATPAHKVCGEFLSLEAQHYLRRLGVDPVALGAAPISRVRVIAGTRTVEAGLPFPALGLSRLALDEALLGRAGALGAEIVRGQAVECLPGGPVFLATGKHDLRGARRNLRSPPEELVGFKMHLRLRPGATTALKGAVEVILFRGGYAGLQRIEGGIANLCLLAHRDRLRAEGGTWQGLVDGLAAETPHLADRLDGATWLFERPLTVARVPYGHIHRPDPDDTAYRLGDQACVIASFTGDGMAMALHSAALATTCHLRGDSPQTYHRALARDVAGPIRRAQALYSVGRSAPGQRLLLAALGLWPQALRGMAVLTRVARANWIEAMA